MKTSVCHYSLNRSWKNKNWDCIQLAEYVKSLGSEGIDFHAGLLGSPDGAAAKIKQAIDRTGLTLTGLSMSNNFNQESDDALKQQVDTVKAWLHVAAETGAQVSRVFGGHVKDRSNAEELKKGFERIRKGLLETVKEAESLGIVLALENHGGLPCTGEEQAQVIKEIGSDHLRATIDVGNYMQACQEGHEGTAIAAPYAAYVHFKDFKKVPAEGKAYGIESCTVGKGDVDHRKCIEALKNAGYDGYIALEYEGPDDDMKGVPESIEFMKSLI